MALHVWLRDLNYAIGVVADLIWHSIIFVIRKLGLIRGRGGGIVIFDIKFLIPNKKRHLKNSFMFCLTISNFTQFTLSCNEGFSMNRKLLYRAFLKFFVVG